MNNKGQTLVLFLFLLPIVFLIFMALYQVGTIELEKKQIESVVKETVEYGINHWSEEEIENQMIRMVENSFSTITQDNIEISIGTGSVSMTVTKTYNVLFLNKQKIRITYVGTNIDGKVQVVKE